MATGAGSQAKEPEANIKIEALETRFDGLEQKIEKIFAKVNFESQRLISHITANAHNVSTPPRSTTPAALSTPRKHTHTFSNDAMSGSPGWKECSRKLTGNVYDEWIDGYPPIIYNRHGEEIKIQTWSITI